MLITQYTALLLQTTKKTALVNPTCMHEHSGGDVFLEPYMQGVGEQDSGSRSSPSPPPHLDPLHPLPKPFSLLASQSAIDQVESSGGSSSGSDGEDAPCDIGLLERLIRSHPVWFLPGIQRAGAFHLLQGKEDGNFVVRQSSQSSTMAISVRLPAGKGPYIEHYLILAAASGELSLESSDNHFESIPALIAHYAQCCDELPVQLTLPRAMREAKNRQQLSSLALLGQEFWRYPMANPRPRIGNGVSILGGEEGGERGEGGPTSSLPSSQASSLSSFGSGNNNGTGGGSPSGEAGDPIVLNLAPLYGSDNVQPSSLLSTFKGSPSPAPSEHICSPTSDDSPPRPSSASTLASRAPRPTPPSTLNLLSSSSNSSLHGGRSASNSPAACLALRTPPPPPPRWAKPPHNFTVTTTVTFSMSQEISHTPPPQVQVSCIQVSPKPSGGDCDSLPSLGSGCLSLDSKRSEASMPPTPLCYSPTMEQQPPPPPRPVMSPTSDKALREESVLSPTVSEKDSRGVMSPVSSDRDSRVGLLSPTEPAGNAISKHPHRRSKRHKESRHYQESDILESPTVYYRSSVADKASDYEDIWGTEALSTFKPSVRSSPFSSPEDPGGPRRNVPDILERLTPTTAATRLRDRTPTRPQETASSLVRKQGSPFYAEPADAIRHAVRRPRLGQNAASNRHSDPPSLPQWPAISSPLQRIDSKEELTNLSSSVDNLAMLRHSRRGQELRARPKPVQPPRVAVRPGKQLHDTSWAVDSSWQFIGNEEEVCSENEREEDSAERRVGFPSLEQQQAEEEYSPGYKGVTIQEIIAQRFPELRLSPEVRWRRNEDGCQQQSSSNSSSRVSAYDNVVNNNNRLNGTSTHSQTSDNDDAQTVFSEPWDSSVWENLLVKGEDTKNRATVRNKSFKERLDPLLSAGRLQALRRGREGVGGCSLRAYALHLAADKSTTFAQNIDNFIACTRESREVRPQVVMRNMRQFMSGMKNYLVKHGEREFEKEVERERLKLRANEFLNLDAILEGVMHRLVVRPLKEHLYRLFVDEYTQNGAIQLLADNISYARTKPLHELGVRAKIIPPSEEDVETICRYLQRLQEVDSPLEKLEHLLAAIAAIFNSVKTANAGQGSVLLGADDFLPLFVWVLVQSGLVAAEIEAEYMWGLLHPSLLSGEGGYYLTTLSSAVHVLKSFRAGSLDNSDTALPNMGYGPLGEFRSVLKIVVPDEMNGSIITKTLPVRPNMSTRELCKIIAHKLRITNPQDYGLYKLVDGEETLLGDSESPQDVKGCVSTTGKHCMFAYKRIDAKIAWPHAVSLQ